MKLRELFYSTFYYIAYRKRTEGGILSDSKWTVVHSSDSEWYADPFLFEWNGRCFLFAERMNRWRLIGSIAVCEIFKNGEVSKFKEVLVEPFHLSYPNVFEYKGQIYMIPESGLNQDIRLYVSTQFPYKWEFVKDLYSGANYVDTSFISKIQDGSAIINSYDWDKRTSHYFKFDLEKQSLSELPDNPGLLNERCGGNMFVNDRCAYRVLQDCSRNYGEKVIINRIECDDFENGLARDTQHIEIRPYDLHLSTNQRPIRCHTYNRSEEFEVVDFQSSRFIWFGPISSIRNKIFYEMHKGE